MMRQETRARREGRGFLARLRRDTSGNTLAMMAAALIPLCGFAGSAMDMARLYVVKVRLQQACDAGALAGRKFLPTGTAANQPLTGNALNQATSYFNTNLTSSWFGSGWYTDTTQSFTPTTIADTQGNTQVQGKAQVDVPMTLMRIFGFTAQTLQVQCQAAFSTPDTDVMFVLDTTGSMGCAVTRDEASCGTTWVPNNGASVLNSDGSTSYYVKEETSGGANVSRIDALRQAVNGFYDTVSKKKDSTTNVRYGFVPYTSTVNVGNLLYGLSPSYLVSNWKYQSRVPVSDYIIKTVASNVVAATDQNACNAKKLRVPAFQVNSSAVDANPSYPTAGTATSYDPVWTAANGNGTGSGNGNSPAKCTLNVDQVGPVWSYQSGVQYDVSNYLKGNSMVDPSRVDGSKTVWNGCIEERDTTPAALNFDPNNLPPDLDPDLVPTSDNTRWRPLWADVQYDRQIYYNSGNKSNLYYLNSTWGSSTLNDNDTRIVSNYNDPLLASGGSMSCPAQAKPLFAPLDQPTGAATIASYVSGLKAIGGTYLDVGMIWGARLVSQTGLWKNNNAWPAGRAAPQPVIIFVTDGDMSPGSSIYGAYGTEWTDRRVTGTTFASTDDPGSTTNKPTYTNFHNQRLLAECAKVKTSRTNGGIGADVWVVEVAQASTASSATQLSQCASRPTQVLVGQDSAHLNAAFQTIAAQVALLRVQQ